MTGGPAPPDDAFVDALELPEEERRAFLRRRLGDDPRALAEALSLLEAHDAAGAFLGSSAADLLDAGARPSFDGVGAGTRVGRYVVEGVLGAGGSGRVFLARQQRPSRFVALKFLGAGLLTEASVERFLAEAELLARLRHPGIAHVYEAGALDVDGRRVPFLALELVEGARDVVTYADSESLDLRARVELAASVCDAVHHGHQKGVLHLDIKPANVLVDASGRAKVIDFGIGHAGDSADLDRPGIVGTVATMSPEQADGAPDGLDVRADVYALGVLTFELLTGRLPVDVRTDDVHEALRRVRDEAPCSASDVDPRLRGELDAILSQALAKDRDGRYPSASALAADLRRHLRHEPVSALPLTLRYQLRTFARRRRVAALSAAGFLVACVCFAAGALALATRAEERRREAEMSAYVSDVSAASSALAIDDVSTARERLQSADVHLRGWEWRHLTSRLDQSVRRVSIPGAHPVAAAVSHDGSRLAVYLFRPPGENALAIVRTEDGAVLSELPIDVELHITALRYAADGGLLTARADGTVEVRRPSGEVAASFSAHDAAVNDVVEGPDEFTLICALRDGSVRMFTRDGIEEAHLGTHADRAICVALSPDGLHVASGGREGVIRIVSLATGECTSRLVGHHGSVDALTWSADGPTLVSAGRDGSLRFWDVKAERERAVRHEHRGVVYAVASVPGTGLVVSGSWDRTLRLWDAQSGEPRGVLRGHDGRVLDVSVSPGSLRVWSAGERGDLLAWDPQPRDDPPLLRGHTDRIVSVAFSPDGSRVGSVAADGRLIVHDVESRQPVAELRHAPGGPGIGFIESGAVVVTSRSAAAEERVPNSDLRLLARHISTSASARCVRGGELLVGTSSGSVDAVVPDAPVRRLARKLVPAPITAMAYVPARDELVLGVRGGSVSVWPLPLAESRAQRVVGEHDAQSMDVTPDAGLIAVGTTSGALRLIDAEDLTTVRTLSRSGASLLDVAFSPDGTRLATAGRDGVVRLWDVASGLEVARLVRSNEPVRCLAWSPDGLHLATAGGAWESPSDVALWSAPPPSR